MIAVEVDDRCGDRLVAAGDWPRLVAGAVELLGVAVDARVGVLWVSREEIGELARTHLPGHDGDSDVLSFPLDGAGGREVLAQTAASALESAASAGSNASPAVDLGDIVVCPDVARQQAVSHSGDEIDEVAVLLVHSCCHLMGHDHIEPAARERMWNEERRLLAGLWRPLAQDPWARR